MSLETRPDHRRECNPTGADRPAHFQPTSFSDLIAVPAELIFTRRRRLVPLSATLNSERNVVSVVRKDCGLTCASRSQNALHSTSRGVITVQLTTIGWVEPLGGCGLSRVSLNSESTAALGVCAVCGLGLAGQACDRLEGYWCGLVRAPWAGGSPVCGSPLKGNGLLVCKSGENLRSWIRTIRSALAPSTACIVAIVSNT